METITSRKNPLIVHMKKLGTDRSYRYECGEFLCQGMKLYEEALKSKATITVVLSNSRELKTPPGVRNVEIPKDILESVSPMESAPDIVFSCRMPTPDNTITEGRHIILEDLQDPGNVGTVIRTANAFKIDTVILTGNSADPYNPKTVRASMGAVFRQRVLQIPRSELIAILKQESIPLFAAGLDSDCLPIDQISEFKSIAVAIGNEGQGLSPEMFAVSEKRIKIPMNPECESLNAAVAAAIIMWELFR